jgi:hypothetical protein
MFSCRNKSFEVRNRGSEVMFSAQSFTANVLVKMLKLSGLDVCHLVQLISFWTRNAKWNNNYLTFITALSATSKPNCPDFRYQYKAYLDM